MLTRLIVIISQYTHIPNYYATYLKLLCQLYCNRIKVTKKYTVTRNTFMLLKETVIIENHHPLNVYILPCESIVIAG